MLVDISNTQAGVSAADGKANMATSEVLPVFDFAGFLSSGGQSELEPQELENCKQLAECLRQTGILIVRDPRVQESDNNKFIDLMVNVQCVDRTGWNARAACEAF